MFLRHLIHVYVRHFAGDTVVRKIEKVPAMVQISIQQIWLQMPKRNTDMQKDMENINRVTEHILELTVGLGRENTVSHYVGAWLSVTTTPTQQVS